jgi:hypothetical protein
MLVWAMAGTRLKPPPIRTNNLAPASDEFDIIRSAVDRPSVSSLIFKREYIVDYLELSLYGRSF